MIRPFLLTCAVFLTACGSWTTERASDDEKMRRVAEMAAVIRADLPTVPEWTPQEVWKRRSEIVLVDVRPAEERALSMIPGAISLEEWERTPVRNRPVAAYCTIGRRSAEWVKRQRARGVDAYNLTGSLLAWTHAGLPLADAAGESTRRLHVYGPRWDLAPADYETAW